MSEIKKGERKESKLEVIHKAYQIRIAVTHLAENNFYFSANKIRDVIDRNTKNIPDENERKAREKRIINYFNNQIIRITDKIINTAMGISEYLRGANTIYPNNKLEVEERRLEIDKALECCNVLQDELQYAGECLYADLNKYTALVLEIQKEFNMIKKLRQSDNKRYSNIID